MTSVFSVVCAIALLEHVDSCGDCMSCVPVPSTLRVILAFDSS